jgi:hypothetical protein
MLNTYLRLTKPKTVNTGQTLPLVREVPYKDIDYKVQPKPGHELHRGSIPQEGGTDCSMSA